MTPWSVSACTRCCDKGDGREHGDQVVGVDKGDTEALVDSDGTAHGRQLALC